MCRSPPLSATIRKKIHLKRFFLISPNCNGMGYIPLLLMSSFLLLVPGNTLDFTDSISLYIFFGLRGSFPSPCCHTITSFLIYMQQSSAVLLMFPCCRFQEHADLLNLYHKLSAFSVLGNSQLLSNTLSFELFDLLFSSSSSSDGTIGFSSQRGLCSFFRIRIPGNPEGRYTDFHLCGISSSRCGPPKSGT